MAEGCGTLWRRDSSSWVIVVYEVHILTRQSLTRKERLEGKSGLLKMINMIWGRGFGRKLGGGSVCDALEKK